MKFGFSAHRASRLSSLLALSSLSVAISAAFAAEPTDLGTVGASGSGASGVSAARVNAPLTNATPAPESRAADVAVTRTNLQATQPQSIIGRSVIEELRSPTADFSTIAVIAPSMTLGISANGPGLGESKNGLRGFKDGEFNVTYDGIPFGDTNGATHHSTAYFPAEILDRVVVERGPGQASDLGPANFGGSVNLFSRDPSLQSGASAFASHGSFNTQIYGVRLDSGSLEKLGDSMVSMNYQQMASDGYRTHMNLAGQNLAVKFLKPLTDHTLMTVNLNYNTNWYQQNDNDKGLTQTQAALYGKNYSLGTDPTKANYYGYNRADKSTVMNYVGLQSDLGNGWALDNKTYYYNYTNNTVTTKASDLTAGGSNVTLANGTVTTGNTQMAGGYKTNEYWVAGNVLKASKRIDGDLVRAGIWFEKADTHRSYYDMDLATGLKNYDQAAVPSAGLTGINNVAYEQKSSWQQYQPFVEYEWNISPKVKVTPGVKYVNWDMKLDAAVNQTARQTQLIERTYNATLPFLSANYRVDPSWSTYFQFAKAIVVPDIGSYQSANAQATNVEPQTSSTYQVGTIHQMDRLTLDADVYYIEFNNKIAVLPGSNTSQPTYYNQGGVNYKGVEGQMTYALSGPFSLYANGSVNRAVSRTSGLTVAGAPRGTEAVGLLYRSGGVAGTLLYKRVGPTYALDDSAYPISSYSTTDLALSYSLKNPGSGVRNMKLQLGLYNIWNHRDVIAVTPANKTAGTQAYGTTSANDTFLWQPPRSFMATVRLEI